LEASNPSRPSAGRLAVAYCCAVLTGGALGIAALVAPDMKMPGSLLEGALALPRMAAVVVFLLAEVFPLLFLAGIPFTAVATLLLLRADSASWPIFAFVGALCPASIVAILLWFGPEQRWDFSVSPPRQVPAFSLGALVFMSILFAPAGAVAGWIYWLVGFRAMPRREASA